MLYWSANAAAPPSLALRAVIGPVCVWSAVAMAHPSPGRATATAGKGSARMETFGTVLAAFRSRQGLSQLGLAKISGVHASIINRFERDERQPADRDMIDRLAEALHLMPAEQARLLAAGGFFPAPIQRLGAADPDLLLLADILADETIPAPEREEMRHVVRAVARRWRVVAR